MKGTNWVDDVLGEPPCETGNASQRPEANLQAKVAELEAEIADLRKRLAAINKLSNGGSK